MAASRSIGALRDSILRHRPGATIWGKGDAAHQQRASDHNEDDTPGVVAEQSDSDTAPEYRGIDVKIDTRFTVDDAHALVRDITTIEANRRRARYVIFLRTIYRRATGYQPEPYTGDNPHTTHVHVSSHVSDDANGSAWTLTNLGETVNVTELHALLTQLVNADDPTERQARDMITGGVHSHNPNGWGLLTRVMDAVKAVETKVDALSAKIDAIPAAQLGDHHHEVSFTGATTGPVVEE